MELGRIGVTLIKRGPTDRIEIAKSQEIKRMSVQEGETNEINEISQGSTTESLPSNAGSGHAEGNGKTMLRQERKELVRKVTNEVEKAFNSKESISKRQLNKWKFSIETSLEQIKELDENNIAEIVEAGDEVQLEAEVEETSMFYTDMKAVIEGLNDELAKFTGMVKSENRGYTETRPTINAKLPKLNLRRFDGDPIKWMSFWDSFEGNIHSRSEVSEREKFDYLTGLLDGDVLKVIDNYRLDNRNYQAAINLLKERYGDTEKICSMHYQALLNIQPVYRDYDLKGIRKFYTEMETNHRAVLSLGRKQENYSDILVPQLEDKLPSYLRISVLQQKKDSTWNMEELLTVLQKEIKIRESNPQGTQEISKATRKDRQIATGSALIGKKSSSKDCPYCLGDHRAEQCKRVTELQERKALLKKYMRCFCCLKRGHRIKDCHEKKYCINCGGKHHISICDKGKTITEESSIPSLHARAKGAVALETLQAFVKGKNGSKAIRCRLILDTGSQFTFITKELADMLRVEPTRTSHISLSGIGKSEGIVRTGSLYEVSIEGLDHKASIDTEVHTLPEISRITNVKPHVQKEKYKHLKSLWFPDVSEKSELEVHVLIGVNDYHRIVTGTSRRGESQSEPIAIETIFGWTLSGEIKDENLRNAKANVHLAIDSRKSESELHKLWDYESIGIREETDVHTMFKEAIEFTGERYRVKLPWKEGDYDIPNNKEYAEQRLKTLMKRLEKNPEVLKEYDLIMKEQLANNIMEPVEETEKKEVHYLPHHPVVRESAETTKVRIVYDASAKARKGDKSLNECLHTGPSLAPLLYDVLLRMRAHPIMLVADIEKAFLQIEIDKDDRDYLRLFWFEDLNDDNKRVKEYRFTRVIFGAVPSPFLLCGTLNHHLAKYQEEDREFVERLKKSLYVDDAIIGCDTVEDGIIMFQKASARLKEGGFTLRKWNSSNEKVREFITKSQTTEVQSFARQIELEKDSTKVLGLKWDQKNDKLAIKLESNTSDIRIERTVTKRNMLSRVSEIFDPLGVASPVTIKGRIMLQDVCKSKKRWDERVESDIEKRYVHWTKELNEAKQIVFSRSLKLMVEDKIEFRW